jgi:hypothetical protein
MTYRSITEMAGSENFFPAAVIVLLILNILVLVTGTISFYLLYRIAMRPLPTLVQVPDSGEVNVVTSRPSSYREPAVIKKFVGDTLAALFNWTSRYEVEERGERQLEDDPGIEVARKKDGVYRVPTYVWQSSFAIAESERIAILQSLAETIPPGVWGGTAYGNLKIRYLNEPESIDPGLWRVRVIADLVIVDRSSPAGRAVPMNATLRVRAVENLRPPLEETQAPIAQFIHRARLARLEIEQVRFWSETEPKDE